MPTASRCPQCGASRSDATDGLCTACLLEEGLEPLEPGRSMPRPGRFGDYELLEEIARGGMGVVYKARQIGLNRVVAVKMILSGQFASAAEMQRFRAEARAAAALQHPGIVAIHEVGEHEGLLYFSMDFVEGTNLAQLVRDGPWPAARAAQCVRDIAKAIHYAHEHGVLHRDLKPSNVLIDVDGKPHVTDFGLAKRLDSDAQLSTHDLELTLSGQLLGSPNFMPPEQAAGKHRELTPAADVYSLGALLYHLLTGRPPFLADNIPATLRLVAETEPVAPRLLVPSVRRDLETICLKCLEKDPRRRYGTARELAGELDRFLNDVPIHARPVLPVERVGRWCRRHPIIAGLSAIIALLLTAVALISSVAATRLQRANREGQAKLREAYLSQARASRWSGRPGRRFDSLDAIRKAMAIQSGPDLRDEAIAAMALVDLRRIKTWEAPNASFALDPRYEQYGQYDTNGTIIVRRVHDDSEVARLPGFGIPMHGFGFSPDGRLLAAHYRSETRPYAFACKVYDLQDSGKVRLNVPDRWVRCFPFSSDGRMLAMSWSALSHTGKTLDKHITFYNLDTGHELNSCLTENLPYGVAFSPDDSRLAVSSAESLNIHIYSVSNGQKLQTLVNSNGMYGLSWDADGRRLAAASADGNIHVWNLSINPPTLSLLPHKSFAMSAVFHPRNDLLMSFGWDHLARLWNPDTGRELLHLPADWIGPFSPDGRWIRVNPGLNSIGLFEVAPANECRSYHFSGTRNGARRAVHSPDGRWLASAHREGLRLTDLRTGNGCHFPDVGDIRGLEFTRNGQALVTAGERGVHWWPVRLYEDARKTRIEVGPPTPLSREQPGSVNSTGRMLAVASDKAYIFDSTSFRIERRLTTAQGISEGVLSPDGRHCATWNRDSGAVDVWDAADGRRLTTLGPPPSPCVSFSPDARWLVTGTSDEYRFWDTGSWILRKTLSRGVTGASGGEVAFTPDSAVVALAIARGEVGLYDTGTFELLATLEPPEVIPVSDLEFSPDGAHLAVGVVAPFIYRWDLRLIRQQLAELKLDIPRPAPPAAPPSSALIELSVIGASETSESKLQALSFSPRDSRCTTNQIDLTAFYNATLTKSWFNPKWEQNDLSQLPHGLQTLDGVSFDIRGIVQLSCSHRDLALSYPKEVTSIPVGQTSRVLHFLHSAGWAHAVGGEIGEYVIHYYDGVERTVPLIHEENIWNWWDLPGRTAPMKPGTTLAWRGRNPWSARAGIDLLLFHFRWENPRPDAPIASLTFRSRMTQCAPFLIAITAE